jgi:hypothetical protein
MVEIAKKAPGTFFEANCFNQKNVLPTLYRKDSKVRSAIHTTDAFCKNSATFVVSLKDFRFLLG